MFMKDRCSEFDEISHLVYRHGIGFEKAIKLYASQNHKSPEWTMTRQHFFSDTYGFSVDWNHLDSIKRLIDNVAAPLSSFYTFAKSRVIV